jgi:hypothetical protein
MHLADCDIGMLVAQHDTSRVVRGALFRSLHLLHLLYYDMLLC